MIWLVPSKLKSGIKDSTEIIVGSKVKGEYQSSAR